MEKKKTILFSFYYYIYLRVYFIKEKIKVYEKKKESVELNVAYTTTNTTKGKKVVRK